MVDNPMEPSSGVPTRTSTTLSGSVGMMGAANIVAFAAGIARQKVFAVFLGPAGVGALSLAVAFFELLSTVVRMGVPTGLLREASRALAADQPQRVHAAYRDSSRRLLLVCGVLFAATVALARPLQSFVFDGALPIWAAPTLAAGLPFLLVAQLRESLLSAYGRVARLATSKIAVTVGTLAATVLLVWRWGLQGGVVQVAAGAVVAMLVTAWMVREVFTYRGAAAKSVPRPESSASLKRIVRVGAAEALYHVGVTLNLLIFRSVVVAVLGLGANGLYQVVLGLSRQYVPAVLGGVFVVLYPRLSAAADRAGEFARERASALQYVFALGVPLALGLLATRDWLIRIVLTSEFAPAEALFRFTAPGDVLVMLAGVLQISLLASGRNRRFVTVGLLSEAITLATFVVALRYFALDGAAAAYLIGGAVAVASFGAAQGVGPRALARDVGVTRMLAGGVFVGGAAYLPVMTGALRAAVLAVAVAWLWAHRRLLWTGRAP